MAASYQLPNSTMPRLGRLRLGRVWGLPLGLVAVLAGLTIAVQKIQRLTDRDQAQTVTALFRTQFAHRIQAVVQPQTRPLYRKWLAGRFAKQEDFTSEASQTISAVPVIVSMAWIDGDDYCRGVVGQTADVPRVGQNLQDDPLWLRILNDARSHNSVAASSVRTDGTLGPVLLAALPGVVGQAEGAPSPGAILFELRLSPILEELSDPTLSDKFFVQLSDDGKPFYNLPARGADAGPDPIDPASAYEGVYVLDRTWQLRMMPTEAFLQPRLSHAPPWALWVWLAGALLLLASVYQAIRYQKLNDQRLRHHLDALETLVQTSASILGAVGSNEKNFWELLPEAARSLTKMAMATVVVLEDNGTMLRVVANAGVDPPLLGKKFTLDQMPTARQCIASLRPLIVSDTRKQTAPMNPALVRQYGLRSLLQVPLIVEGKPIGAMLLGDRQVRHFSDAEVRLAELWGTFAAVAIADDKLYEQSRTALAAQNKLLEQRDALFAVNDAILRAQTTEEILQRIVDLAPGPLDVDLCQLVFLAEQEDELVVAAITQGFAPELIGYRYRAQGTNSGRAIAQRQLLVIENGGPQNTTLHPKFRNMLPCGSLVYAPLLRGDGKPLGVLVLLRKNPGKFSKEQLGLAHHFVVRAAGAIESAQLYQQTRRDADANAALLRELNHRVKNNLAGIVALLSLNQPSLPPNAQKWLERVVDRIRTLARTHEMLNGGLQRASLRELIEQNLHALSVVTPPSIKVRTEIQRADVLLRTDRAVALAMVLHELCYNAIVHGLEESGHLLIRASLQLPNFLLIEVIDDGRGFSEPPQDSSVSWQQSPASVVTADRRTLLAPARTGLGLSLVRDFVTRELHGLFTVISSPGAGATARVEFPLLDDELPPAGRPVMS
jgi:two-component sensor histidine kinase